jgi:hypothetical protein
VGRTPILSVKKVKRPNLLKTLKKNTAQSTENKLVQMVPNTFFDQFLSISAPSVTPKRPKTHEMDLFFCFAEKGHKPNLTLLCVHLTRTSIIPYMPCATLALGRLSPAKAADAFFTLIRPEFYPPDSQRHLAAQSANSCDWVSFRLPAPARGRQKNRGNILTMPANWAEKNAAY